MNLSYQIALSLYKFGLSLFFKMGGAKFLRANREPHADERMGILPADIPKGAFWIHVIGEGEMMLSLVLIDKIKKNSTLPCVLSVEDQVCRNLAETMTKGQADAIFYRPIDAPEFVRKALDALQPRVYVTIEKDRRPCLLAELVARKIPSFLVSAYLSDESFKKREIFKGLWNGIFSCFSSIMPRAEEDKNKFLALGVPNEKLTVIGDCKIDAMLFRKNFVSREKWLHLRAQNAPLFIAGSTRTGEDIIILEAYKTAREKLRDARLIIAPRYPDRSADISRIAYSFGRVARLSEMDAREPWDILIIDKIGVLFELYSVCDAAFIGGSLVPKGGHNLMEAVLFGVQVSHGPDMRDFPASAELDAIGAAAVVRDASELAERWINSVNSEALEKTRAASEAYFAKISGAVERAWKIIGGRGMF